MTVMSSAAGVVVLSSYFRLIGFVPDASSLIGASVLATAALLALLTAIVLVMQAPAALVRIYGLPLPNWFDAFLGQMLVTALMAEILVVHSYAGSYWATAGLLSFTGALMLVLFFRVSKRKDCVWRYCAALITVGAAFVFVIQTALVVITAGAVNVTAPEWAAWLGLAGVLVVSSLLSNLALLGQRHAWKISSGLSAVVVILLLCFATPSGFTTTRVARLIGLTIPGQVELRVNRANCLAILSSVRLAGQSSAFAKVESDGDSLCREIGNRVTASVDFRWNSRWLLRVAAVNGMSVDPLSPRVTISDSGTELVLPPRS
ncbi:MAG: hypothetical protein JSR41_17420 [Proteobacteria bacterium]|nr:hypothetical protein [Pseudomonadota bacterium]